MCHAVSKSTAVCLVVMMATVGLVGLVRGQPQPNYDPPQPSSEFGTPEATAKIAEKAGFLDVVGVKLGMSPKDAVAAAKAHNAALAFDPKAKLEYEALPGVAMLPVLASTQNAKTSAEGGSEYMGLLVTYPPNEAFVYGVWRDFSFGRPESRPTIDYIVNGLRKKYGLESAREDTLLIWLFDAQRQQVMGAKAMDIWKKCANHWMTGAEYDMGNIGRQITRGYYVVNDGRDYHNGACHSHSLVQARYLADQDLRSSQPLVMNVKIRATNHQLEASGVTAANVLLTREATKLADKRKEEASKRAAPKF